MTCELLQHFSESMLLLLRNREAFDVVELCNRLKLIVSSYQTKLHVKCELYADNSHLICTNLECFYCDFSFNSCSIRGRIFVCFRVLLCVGLAELALKLKVTGPAVCKQRAADCEIMALLIKAEDDIFVGLLQHIDAENIRFMSSNLKEFFSETIAESEFIDRLQDVNDSVFVSTLEQVKKVMLNNPAASSEIRREGDNVIFEMNYKIAGGKQMKVLFETKKSLDEERNSFINSMMKTAFENNLLVKRMKLELEKKDAEIEDYKSNGAVLVRGEMQLACYVKCN